MPDITASMVKDLREKTGAGMMDCKKALIESGGDMEVSVDWLRKKGLAAAAKKAGRVAAEGLVAVATDGTSGAVVELNAETDFVSRNGDFQAMAAALADIALKEKGDLDRVRAATMGGKTVDEALTDLIARIGENMALRRTAALTVVDGIVASYVHNKTADGLGRIGVLIALESTGDKAALGDLGRQFAMHVAAARPASVTIDGVDPAAVARERDVLAEQARASGRPEEVIEKMVEGRLRKFYEDTVLMEQVFVIDGKTRVAEVLKQAEASVGAPVAISGFVRFEL
ncbi:MAG: translation elongation factor Ts, partial [Alphaproteobacteria bacterium]